VVLTILNLCETERFAAFYLKLNCQFLAFLNSKLSDVKEDLGYLLVLSNLPDGDVRI